MSERGSVLSNMFARRGRPLSEAMKTGMVKNSATAMGREARSAFSTYGGYISGRQIELVPGERIVQ